MDAGEQAPLAPLGVRVRRQTRGEAPAQHEALPLEGGQGRLDAGGRQAEDRGEPPGGHRPRPLEPAAHQLDQRLLGRPGPREEARRRGDRGLQAEGHITSIGTPAGTSAGELGAAPYTASSCGSRSAATQRSAPSPVESTAARRSATRASNQGPQPAARPSSAVKNPSPTRASCSSSGSATSGQASSRTRATAAASSAPRSEATDGSSQRRVCTAWVRRSSKGASSRKV